MNWISIGLHIGFWIVIMLSFAIGEWTYRDSFMEAILFELLILPARLVAVYINWFVLITRYLYNSNFLVYLILLGMLILVLAVLQRAFLLHWGYPAFFPELVENQPIILFKTTRILKGALIITSPVAFTTGWKLFIDWKEKQERTRALEKEKTETELKYLKSQINPHFLFNTLNNIYGLSLDHSPKVPPLILKLSDFLSFSLYESKQEFIPLEKEIQLMKDFIALEQSRFEDRVSMNLWLPEKIQDVQIPPLTLVPFVENAFKHSLQEEIGLAKIDIHLEVEEMGVLHFRVRNSKPGQAKPSPRSGIGLNNIKKRLDILYADRHELIINNDADSFSIDLKLETT